MPWIGRYGKDCLQTKGHVERVWFGRNGNDCLQTKEHVDKPWLCVMVTVVFNKRTGGYDKV